MGIMRIAFLPDGQDPDSLINGSGKEAFDIVIESAMSMVDFLWMVHTQGQKFDTPEARAGLTKTLDQEAFKIPDRDVQHFYRQDFKEKISKLFGRKQNYGAGGGFKKPFQPWGKKNNNQNQQVTSMRHTQFTSLESKLLAAIVNHPVLFDYYEEEIGMLNISQPRLDALRKAVIEVVLEAPEILREDLHRALNGQGFQSELRALMHHDLYALARFARPSASVEEAVEGWKIMYDGLVAHQSNG